MNLTTHKFKVTGVFPLMTHNPAGMLNQTSGPKTKKIPSAEEEAKAGLYLDDAGNYCLPSVAFRAALIAGLKGKKVGKVGAATVFKPAVFNADELTMILDPETREPVKEYVIDARRALIGKAGIVRRRPKFPKWAAIVLFQIDEEIVSPEQVAEHLNVAGTTVGVGDFRIEKGGQFGSFTAELMVEAE
ncbi:MAG: hypothetical protein U9Q07_00270 [Planctomycetota bacterium]|nr:hypothetical protein [Planctomycetota bacterium]